MKPELVTLNDLEGHSPVAGLFKCYQSNICAAFYQISTDSVLAWSLSDSRASCELKLFKGWRTGPPHIHMAFIFTSYILGQSVPTLIKIFQYATQKYKIIVETAQAFTENRTM